MRRVAESSAAASEARKWSSVPMPTTSGLPARAPTMRPGSRVDITAMAYAPWNSDDRLLDRPQEIAAAGAVPVRVNEVGDHLGVGLRDERIALPDETLAQRLEVLDDAVVNHGDLAVRGVRVRVRGRGRAVRRPARVRDARQTFDPCRLGLRGEVRDAGRGDEPGEARRARRSVDDRESGGVVAAILEAADAVDQDRNDVARRGRADDAAHGWVTFRCAAGA